MSPTAVDSSERNGDGGRDGEKDGGIGGGTGQHGVRNCHKIAILCVRASVSADCYDY